MTDFDTSPSLIHLEHSLEYMALFQDEHQRCFFNTRIDGNFGHTLCMNQCSDMRVVFLNHLAGAPKVSEKPKKTYP